MNCPRDNTPLRTRWGRGTFECATCHHDYVISVTDAWATRAGWNRDAPGAGAVLAVLEATGGRR